MEFGHVRYPLFIESVCHELTVQQIWRHLPDSPPVGTVFCFGNSVKEAKLLHDPLHALAVHGAVSLPESRRDAMVSVSAAAFGEKRLDCCGKLRAVIAGNVFHVLFVGGLAHVCQALKQLQLDSFLALEALYCGGFFQLSRFDLASTKAFSYLGMRSPSSDRGSLPPTSPALPLFPTGACRPSSQKSSCSSAFYLAWNILSL